MLNSDIVRRKIGYDHGEKNSKMDFGFEKPYFFTFFGLSVQTLGSWKVEKLEHG